jgi:hypothetical protein
MLAPGTVWRAAWPIEPMEASDRVDQRYSGTGAGGLMIWAVWTVEGMSGSRGRTAHCWHSGTRPRGFRPWTPIPNTARCWGCEVHWSTETARRRIDVTVSRSLTLTGVGGGTRTSRARLHVSDPGRHPRRTACAALPRSGAATRCRVARRARDPGCFGAAHAARQRSGGDDRLVGVETESDLRWPFRSPRTRGRRCPQTFPIG